MSFQRAKPIDDLYDDVADYDLVVVPDAPLASALNRRLEHPHLGTFATTPRRIAAGRKETAEDRLAFLELVEHTDLGWKASAYAIGNILQCWEHQASIESILDYPAYADATTREAVDYIRDLDTTSSALTDYRIDDSQEVAVVGIDQLTALERSILPDDYDTYSPFVDDTFDYPPFQIFNSPTDIVDTVVDNIDATTADEVAVVLDAQSQYSTLVESALEAADIPFYGGPGFTDDPDHRAFIQLLRTAHAGTDTRVRDIRPLLTRFDRAPSVEHDQKRFRDTSEDAVAWLRDLADTVVEGTFGDALSVYEREADQELTAFREELEELGIHDEPVTERSVDNLTFYLDAYEVPVDRDNDGVLLADATAAAYVDRPLVFHLGLDDSWTQTPPQRPWVDETAQYTRTIDDFQLLLQSGASRHYLVTDTEGGTPVTPCLYFEELLDEDFDQFSDLDSERHTRQTSSEKAGFETDGRSQNTEEIATVSQSSLNTYVNSPRDYYFDRLLDSPDQERFREGTLFHDFAEFYVNHPEFVDDDTVADVVDHMVEETGALASSIDEATRRTRYRVGVETVVEYLDETMPETDTFLSPTSNWGENTFAERYGRPADAPTTERWFENHDLHIEGKIDLVAGPHELVDHKSRSSRNRPAKVVRNASVDDLSDTPNFQALLYLTHWRSENPGERLDFTLFQFLATLDDAITGESDLEECLTTVTYYPYSFPVFAQSQEAYARLSDEAGGDGRKTLSKASYDDYFEAFDTTDFPNTRDKNELLESEFADELTSIMEDAVGDFKYVRNGCKQLLRQLDRIHRRNFFAGDVDAFESFVETQLDVLNARRRGEERFPIEGPAGEPSYRRVDHRDLLLEGHHD
ncbi:PD-(D/E)XK nuclease family protein [Halobacterium litoreum]|uniref:PD-(D/E)XK nuclease family protein n=1 Tax=Halobacterium litoreum TaxID=2039234 RepID=A0ABD5NIR3_9EURY|nr:PD-(D/E)XK nuclease family protein [Halobacterium litoreum]UHH12170.1 PD-(D/E)XK nuclease family protein [Halobacterium litoreum]